MWSKRGSKRSPVFAYILCEHTSLFVQRKRARASEKKSIFFSATKDPSCEFLIMCTTCNITKIIGFSRRGLFVFIGNGDAIWKYCCGCLAMCVFIPFSAFIFVAQTQIANNKTVGCRNKSGIRIHWKCGLKHGSPSIFAASPKQKLFNI